MKRLIFRLLLITALMLLPVSLAFAKDSIPTKDDVFEAKRFNIKMPDKAPMVTQERAYTSLIWHILKL